MMAHEEGVRAGADLHALAAERRALNAQRVAETLLPRHQDSERGPAEPGHGPAVGAGAPGRELRARVRRDAACPISTG